MLHADADITAILLFDHERGIFDGASVLKTGDITSVALGTEELLAYQRRNPTRMHTLTDRYAQFDFVRWRKTLSDRTDSSRPAIVYCERLISGGIFAFIGIEMRNQALKGWEVDPDGRDAGYTLLLEKEISRVDIDSMYCAQLARRWRKRQDEEAE